MQTRIIVDSTANLTPAFQSRVHTVPLTLRFGEEEYIDGVTIDHKTFYEKLIESDVLPTTSQATPFAFEEAYAEAVAAGVIQLLGKGGPHLLQRALAERHAGVEIADAGQVFAGEQVQVVEHEQPGRLEVGIAGHDTAQLIQRVAVEQFGVIDERS